MGEVYLAKDRQLDRHVAVKLLLPQLTKSEEHLFRFKQEARAASSLNHPNIITVHEIGQIDDAHFIVTEFIDDVTLRQRMLNTGMKIEEALKVAIQLASALTAAHAAGIVHRDIKPENVMLRMDGYVKVLDFGLAKLAENPPNASVDLEASTVPNVNTGPGAVIGTALYMSPEQLRGLKVDARTDIWSLGVMLYEMIAGRTPFEGATSSEITALILDREPPPLFRYSLEVPPEMQRIVMKALRKDREERYQTAKDLLIDLKTLDQELEFEAKTNISLQPEIKDGADVNLAGEQLPVETSPVRAASPTNSIEQIISEIKQQKNGAILILCLLLAGVSWWLYEQLRPAVSFGKMRVSRLTYTSQAVDVAISPDGKYVVYLIDDGGQQSLWLRQVAGTEKRQMVGPAYVQYQALTFSPDGNYVYGVRYEGNSSLSTLYQISVLGDSQRKLMEDVDSAITFSPDGKRLAFVRGYASKGEDSLIVANVDGTQEQKLATCRRPEFFRRTDFFTF